MDENIESESLRETIRSMVSDGISRTQVVKQLNATFPNLDLTYGQVHYLTSDLKAVKIDITGTKAWIGDRPRVDVIMELYDSGVRPRDISEQLGVDQKKVLSDISRIKNKRAVEEARKQYARQILQS